jgi:hypothetical protein
VKTLFKIVQLEDDILRALALAPTAIPAIPPVVPLWLPPPLEDDAEILLAARLLTKACFKPADRWWWAGFECIAKRVMKNHALTVQGVSWPDGTRALLIFSGPAASAGLGIAAYKEARSALEKLVLTHVDGGTA